MPALIAPDTRVHASFLTAMAEFQAEGRGGPDDNESMIGAEIREHGADWSEPSHFDRYVSDLQAQRLEDTPRPDGYVPCTTLWWATGDRYLGRLAIRHRLTPHGLARSGHIGYDVRPSARRQGHATAMLAAALPLAWALGITSALLTCDVTNVASRRVIEANGGVLQDQRDDILRFWVPTAS